MHLSQRHCAHELVPLGLLLGASGGGADLQSLVQHLFIFERSHFHAAGTCIFRWTRRARTWGSNGSGDHLLLVVSSKRKAVPVLCLSTCCMRQASRSAETGPLQAFCTCQPSSSLSSRIWLQGLPHSSCRLVAGAYDENGDKQLGTGCSAPIRVLANNDVPTGAACIKLHLSLE